MPATDQQLIAGRYARDEVLGRGGAGVVWRGRDTVLGRPVAIKAFKADLAAVAGIDSTVDRRRVMREARHAARLTHPGAVQVFDVVEHDERLHLVMELVDAPDLAALVAAEGPLDPARAADVGLQLLDVLEAAHAIGLVHRDVKPSNVLVQPDGRVRLTDFGTAVLTGEDRLTATDVVIGSPAYMAPEQATGGDVAPPADLWSLGATLYQAVEGVPPFSGPSPVATMHAVLHDDPRPAVRAGPLQPVVDRLLVRDPDGRATAAEARAALTAVAPTPGAVDHPRVRAGSADHVDTWVVDDPRVRAGSADHGETWVVDDPRGWAGSADHGVLRSRGRGRGRRQTVVVASLLLVVAAGLTVLALDRLALDRSADVQPADDAAEVAEADEVADSAPSGGTAAGAADEGPDDPADAEEDDAADDAPDDVGDGDAGGRGEQQGQGQGPQQGQGQGVPQGQAGGATAVPDGWVVYDPDHAPYRLAHPPGWTVERLDATRTDLEDPDGPTYLRLDWTDDPAPDPLADWEAYEADFAAGRDGYERIRLEPTTFDGEPAALWEYRYRAGGTTLRAYNLNVAGREYGYALNYQSTEAAWPDVEPRFWELAATYDIG